MTKEELLRVLQKVAKGHDMKAGHTEADKALLAYINDPEITEAYKLIENSGGWYA
jgi:hypothetical protein